MKISNDPSLNQPEMSATVSIYHPTNGEWQPRFLLLKQGTAVEFTEDEVRQAVQLLTNQLVRYENGDVERDIARLWGNGTQNDH